MSYYGMTMFWMVTDLVNYPSNSEILESANQTCSDCMCELAYAGDTHTHTHLHSRTPHNTSQQTRTVLHTYTTRTQARTRTHASILTPTHTHHTYHNTLHHITHAPNAHNMQATPTNAHDHTQHIRKHTQQCTRTRTQTHTTARTHTHTHDFFLYFQESGSACLSSRQSL